LAAGCLVPLVGCTMTCAAQPLSTALLHLRMHAICRWIVPGARKAFARHAGPAYRLVVSIVGACGSYMCVVLTHAACCLHLVLTGWLPGGLETCQRSPVARPHCSGGGGA
jgi:hypothetical protein